MSDQILPSDEESARWSDSCAKYEKPDRMAIFAKLREMWLAEGKPEEKRTYAKLAVELNTTRNLVSRWATGSGNKKQYLPPWYIIMRLCDMLGLVVVMHPKQGCTLNRVGRSK